MPYDLFLIYPPHMWDYYHMKAKRILLTSGIVFFSLFAIEAYGQQPMVEDENPVGTRIESMESSVKVLERKYNDLKKQSDEAQKVAKEAREAEMEARRAYLEAKKALNAEKKALKAREKADKQAAKAREVGMK